MDAIGVIGMALRVPCAQTPSEFWTRLNDRQESIRFFAADELLRASVPAALLDNNAYVRAAGVLERAEEFDAAFFGVTPRAAELIDPQHRVFLELAWEALEDAAIVPGDGEHRIGLYAGSSQTSWLASLGRDADAGEAFGSFQTAISTGQDFLTTRVSYALNLTGPSVTVQTACSTSLVAIAQACDALLSYQADVVLAGGVAIRFPQERGYTYEPGMIYSPDGHCRPFDRQAQGCVGGNGAGLVVLKRLHEAREHGDPIRAVIRGWAINNDGSRKVGYTAPGLSGQIRVIRDALRMAAIDPDTIGFVEAHGTGTPLGDSIEVEALKEVFHAHTSRRQFCALGSVKSNIGHLDAAAGVIGLIKAVLAVERGTIPPTLHFREANPALSLDESAFFVNSEPIDWPHDDSPRRAAISAFGIGGTNAHVILEEPPAPRVPSGDDRCQVLLVSARTGTALDASCLRVADAIAGGAPVADVAYTLQTGRKRFAHRRAVVCRDAAQAVTSLRDGAGPSRALPPAQGAPRLAFMIPGGGAQYAGMAAGLYRAYPAFSRAIDECCDLFVSSGVEDFRAAILTATDAHERTLRRGTPGLAALFTVEVAVCRLLESWGVRPDALLGHSLGEYVAATIAGVMSLRDAAALVAARASLFQRLAPGAMTSVTLPEAALLHRLDRELAIAAVNGPSACVVSGPVAAIESFEARLGRDGLEFRRLHVDVAGHSPMLDVVLDDFEAIVRRIELHPPRLPFVSSLSGDWIRSDQAIDPAYWRQQLRETVRFADGLATLRSGTDVMLEVGPGTTLSALAGEAATPVLRHVLDRSRSDEEQLLAAVGRLWLDGLEPAWDRVHEPASPRRIALPAYPFERRRYAPDRGQPRRLASDPDRWSPDRWFYVPQWKATPPPVVHEEDAAEAWIVLSRGEALDRALIGGLRSTGHDVLEVRIAGDDGRSAADAISVRPDVAADYEPALRHFGDRPLRVVHTWTAAAGAIDFTNAQRAGYHSLVALAGALAGVDRPARLDVISRGLHGIGAPPAAPGHATLLGPCATIPQELPGVSCRDLDLAADPTDSDIDCVRRELLSRATDTVVAYRCRQRFVRTFDGVPLTAASGAPLRAGGVYLISGAAGEIGRFLAETFASTVNCRLVLITRRPPADDPALAATLQAIRAAGSEVIVEVADVADAEAMRRLRARVDARFGAINGLVHAAGITKGSSVLTPLAQLTRADAEMQFRAKIGGVFALDSAFGDLPLDFAVLMSSNASVLGGAGLAAYAAANACMDAFASARAATSAIPWISAGWDGWRVGAYAAAGAARTSIDRFAMTGTECLGAFWRIAASGLRGHVVVSRGEFLDRLARPDAPSTEPPARSTAEDETFRPSAGPRTTIEERIAAIWEEHLGIEPIGPDANFFDLGGQSLLGLRVTASIRSAFDVTVGLRTLFEHPTVAAMARVVVAELQQRTAPSELTALVDELERMTEAEAEDLLSHG